jgi:arylsulfatase
MPWWPPKIVPPRGAPNVLLIITDDVGFGAPGTFGGVIPTPTLDRVANAGLRYTSFHSTALCSPTRAALITGRNHHTAHSGVITEQATGFPGYDSVIQKDTATLGEILRQNGYSTSWFGKDHNTPEWMSSQVGPFDNWPVGYGFEYFFGFIGGDTSQWQPNLYQNTTPIEPFVGKPGWNLTTAMADDAIRHLRQMNDINPDQPFFIYYAPGGTHAPHHPTPEWIQKFKGKFDMGWNALREQVFANQKRLGVVAQNATLTPWPDHLPKWDSLAAEDKKLFARQAEVYAAYLAYTDHEIGRVIDAVGDLGKLDDTLVIYISGDNGSSAEGTLAGTPNEIAVFNGMTFSPRDQMKYYDLWGSDQTYPLMAVEWSWAFDTPFKWTKQIASHFGGTRQGMAIAWPKRIKDRGGIRTQFHHVVDIAPTVLEACRIPQPTSVNGVKQKQMEGVSLAYTWDKTKAQKPSKHLTQYFEMMGHRGIYHDGWIASTTPPIAPWRLGIDERLPADVLHGYRWELYNLKDDPTQNHDLAKEKPGKLREMQKLFMKEAEKHNVLPLDNSVVERVLAPRPSVAQNKTHFVYSGSPLQIPHGSAPSLLNRSFTITADVIVPDSGGDGMIVTHGGRFGGYGFYVLKGKPVFLYNLSNLERFRWTAPEPLTPGEHKIKFAFSYAGGSLGKGGTGTLSVDGKEKAVQSISHTTPFIFQWDEDFTIAFDTGTPVDDQDYQIPFRFNGEIKSLALELGRLQLSAADKDKLKTRNFRNNPASE